MNKFELSEHHTITYENKILYRIKALRDFGLVKAGDLGGYVETPDNLSQLDDCWIFQESIAMNEGWVYKNARLSGQSIAKDECKIGGDSYIYGHNRIQDNANISGNTRLLDYAVVGGYSHVRGNIKLGGNTLVLGSPVLSEKVSIIGDIIINGSGIEIRGDNEITGRILIGSNTRILGKGKIDGVKILDNIKIVGGDIVKDNNIIEFWR